MNRFIRLVKEITGSMHLCGPIMVTQVLYVLINSVDVMYLGRHNTTDMAGASLAMGIWVTSSLVIHGMMLAIPPIISEHRHCSTTSLTFIHQSGWIALLLSTLLAGLLLNSQLILQFIDTPDELKNLASDYLYYITPGIFAFSIFHIFRATNEGFGNSKSTMKVGFIALPLKVMISFFFINGHIDNDIMGVRGAAISTSITFLIMAAFIFYESHKILKNRKINLLTQKPKIEITPLKSLIKFGTPIALTVVLEESMFTVSILLVSSMGEVKIAAHQIGITILTFMFMIPFSISSVTAVRVASNIKQNHLSDIILAPLLFSFLLSIASALILITLSEPITKLFTSDPDIIELVKKIIPIIATIHIFDSTFITISGIMRGLGDTQIALRLCLLSHWVIAMPLSYLLIKNSVTIGGNPILPIWLCMLLGFIFASITFAFKLRKKYKDTIKQPNKINTTLTDKNIVEVPLD